MKAARKLMNSELSLRAIYPDDIGSVATLHESQNQRPADRRYIGGCIAKFPSSLCLRDQQLLGFAYGNSFAPDVLQLSNIVVDREHRGRGIGTSMLAHIEEQARSR